MYNLRYHIASLVAVFLALSVGLLLGTIVVDRGVIETQRTTLVASIGKSVDKVTAANQQLRDANASLTEFATQSAPQLLRYTLAGRTVLVIADPDAGDTVARTTEALRLAGATPTVVTITGPGLSLGDAKVADAAMKALGSPPASELETRVISELAREWTTSGDGRDLTAALIGAGGLELQGLAATDTVDGIALTATYGGAPDGSALALTRALTGPGRFGAGVETTKQRTGQAKSAFESGLSGVDDMDSPLGQVSLVWVLAGRATGSFGTAKGAGAAFPDPLFPKP